jgi:hypothetical protein
MKINKIYNIFINFLILVLLSVSSTYAKDGISGLTGVYTGEYQIIVRSHPTGSILGYGVRDVAWAWDFDNHKATIKGTTLSVGFNYAIHDIDNANKDNDIIDFVDNEDGTYTAFFQFQIYKSDLGYPRANTSTTFKITKENGVLNINAIDAEEGELDGILGTQIVGVFPLTIEPSMQGTARGEGVDQNDDGITDEDAIRLGLDPSKLDSDADGISDIDEVGDINNPIDSDGDGIINALEPGDSAYAPNLVYNIKLLTKDTISIKADEGINLSKVSVESMEIEIPDNTSIEDLITKDLTLGQPGLDYALGNLSFKTTLNNKEETLIKLSLSSELPTNLLVYAKEFESKNYVLLSNEKWNVLDSNTIEITVTDKNTYDLDGEKNQIVQTSIALAENTLGDIVREDESAGSMYLSLILLLSTLIGRHLLTKKNK